MTPPSTIRYVNTLTGESVEIPSERPRQWWDEATGGASPPRRVTAPPPATTVRWINVLTGATGEVQLEGPQERAAKARAAAGLAAVDSARARVGAAIFACSRGKAVPPIAFHEAGHATVALALGHEITVVTIDQAEASRLFGRPAGGVTARPAPAPDPLHDAAITVGGVLVDQVGLDIDFEAALARGASEKARFFELAPSLADQRAAVALAWRSLDAHVPAFLAVAVALSERVRLTGAELLAIFARRAA